MKKILFNLPVALLMLATFTEISCSKKEKEEPKICFTNDLAGNYSGDLTSSMPPLVESGSAARIVVNGCQNLSITFTAISKTYNVTSITTGNGTNYTARTSDNKEVTLRYLPDLKKVEISIEPEITYDGVKP